MSHAIQLSSPEAAASYLYPFIVEFDREHVLALCLNTKNQLIRIYEVSVGGLDASLVHPREVFKTAIICSAAAILLAHNHPSGDVKPSEADRSLTKKLEEASEVLGIPILDHIIISKTGAWASIMNSSEGQLDGGMT